jgi:hypothetical protein
VCENYGRAMDRLQESSRVHFVDALYQFLSHWSELFPACEATKAMLTQWDAGAHGDAARIWHGEMSQRFRVAKYCKALDRLLGEPATCYLACEYRDADALFASVSLAPLTALDIPGVYHSDALGAPQRALFWKYVQTLNRAAALYSGHEMQRAPSRDEIQQNIQQHQHAHKKAGAAPVPSMARAFLSALEGIATVCESADEAGAASLRDYVARVDAAEALGAWTRMLAGDPDVEAKCRGGDASAVGADTWSLALPDRAGGALYRALRSPDARVVCNYLDQMNSFARVAKHIPGTMMSQIEHYADAITKDISSGKCDLGSLDLQRIGQDVLASCKPGDMAALANNIGEILPTLTSLRAGLS